MAIEKKVTAENYDKIKKVVMSGAFTNKEINEMFDISAATISIIKSNDDYEHYHEYVTRKWREANERQKAKKAKEDGFTVTPDGEATPGRIVPNFYEAQLDMILEQLKNINDKLAKLPVMQEIYKEEEPETKRGIFGIRKPF